MIVIKLRWLFGQVWRFDALSLMTGATCLFVLLTVAEAQPGKSILFVGNSFTVGGASLRNYRADTVTDLNGSGVGGVPALFKSFAQQANLDYEVYLETEDGSTLDFHHEQRLDEIGSRGWDAVVMYGYSTLDGDESQDSAKLIDTAAQFAEFLRTGNPEVELYFMATWPRADLVYSETGRWAGEPIENLARDIRAAYENAADPARFESVIPVGEAWTRAMQVGVADSNPYDGLDPGRLNLWAVDHYHGSVYGYYLSALVIFGDVTGHDPRLLGEYECSAYELGISRTQALALQQVASDQLASEEGESPILAIYPRKVDHGHCVEAP